jgi:hypothetical protein
MSFVLSYVFFGEKILKRKNNQRLRNFLEKKNSYIKRLAFTVHTRNWAHGAHFSENLEISFVL